MQMRRTKCPCAHWCVTLCGAQLVSLCRALQRLTSCAPHNVTHQWAQGHFVRRICISPFQFWYHICLLIWGNATPEPNLIAQAQIEEAQSEAVRQGRELQVTRVKWLL